MKVLGQKQSKTVVKALEIAAKKNTKQTPSKQLPPQMETSVVKSAKSLIHSSLQPKTACTIQLTKS